MTVNSFIEIYTTLIGWSFYNSAWTILLGTGIAFLPFIFMLIETFTKTQTSMEANAGSAASVRIMEIKLVFALTAIVLTAQPVMTLVPHQIEYEHPACGGNTARTGDTNTTLDASLGAGQPGIFGGNSTIRVPVWWYGLLQLTSGMNHTLMSSFPCVPDIRAYDQAVRSISIQDRDLRREYDRFANECWIPALTEYNRLNQSGESSAGRRHAIQQRLDQHGQMDPQWMGSRVFRELPGFYNSFRAQRPVPGYAFDANRDNEYARAHEPNYGRPTCLEWWEGTNGAPAGGGLQARLLDELGWNESRSAWRQLREDSGWSSWAGNRLRSFFTGNQDAVAEHALKVLVDRGPPRIATNYGDFWAADQASQLSPGSFIASDGASQVLGGAFMLVAGASAGADLVGFHMDMWIVRAAADMVQALILLAFYGLLPFVLVFSSYSWSAVFTATIAIFTVKFWSVLWMLAWWLDQNLWAALFPDPSLLFGPGSEGLERRLLSAIISALYIGLPILFSIVIAWSGMKGADSFATFNRSVTGGVRSAGSAGGKAGVRAGGAAATKGMSARR
ncbi:MAG: conjugal transfer protein TraG N-terminal domain-containing protein [Dehalococcoidia bacterium]